MSARRQTHSHRPRQPSAGDTVRAPDERHFHSFADYHLKKGSDDESLRNNTREAPDKEELRTKLLKENLKPFAELVYKAADTNSDDAVSVEEFKKLADPDPMDSKSLAETKEQLLKQLAPLEDDTKVEITKLFYNPQDFVTAENLAIYLDSLDASVPVKISLEGNFKAVELLTKNGHLEEALLLLKITDFQISLFSVVGLPPEDAAISHELIQLLVRKLELASGGE